MVEIVNIEFWNWAIVVAVTLPICIGLFDEWSCNRARP